MTETTQNSVGTGSSTHQELLAFLDAKTGRTLDASSDLFASGISSLFALQLVVHLEEKYGVTVGGADLKMDNFRTVDAMVALIGRLRGATG
ncbi:MAG TPA: phosphopantetheine-binding protein [Actinospica sp.]|jgi:methoxymalonate biosynthesis acyl carrier protein|nr:phosphopantetheine-binding protein [Actinospica sp.]